MLSNFRLPRQTAFMKLRDLVIFVNLLGLTPVSAMAHVSEQGFVLLLPTGAYTAAGVAAVVLTVVALFVLYAHKHP